MKTDMGGPAYPSGEKYFTEDPFVGGGKVEHGKSPLHLGMTFLDRCAIQAMGLFSLDNDEIRKFTKGEKPNHPLMANFCYDAAQAMVAERRRRMEAE